jgi:hypothetical protein
MALPVLRRRCDACAHPALGTAGIRQLHDGPWVAFGGERGEAAQRADLSRLANAIASLECTREVGLEGFGPIGEMVQALMARLQKVARHRGGLIARLHHCNLEPPSIGQRHRDMDGRGGALIAKIVHRRALDIIPGADAQHRKPLLHGRGKIAHDIPMLGHRATETAHRVPLFFRARFASHMHATRGGPMVTPLPSGVKGVSNADPFLHGGAVL